MWASEPKPIEDGTPVEATVDTHEAFRDSVRTFLGQALTPELKRAGELTTSVFSDVEAALKWHKLLYAQGWVAADWPEEYGGPGWDIHQRYIFQEECKLANAPSLVMMGIQMLGPMLMHYGTEEQKNHYLPRMLSGEDIWCQGYSEPGAGSDLASLKTTAVRDGDDWVINGVKTWNTGVHKAHSDMVMARTSGGAGDAGGITAFLVPMDSPGVEVEEYLWTFNMPSDHARVRFTNVRVPDSAIFAGEGRGLQVVQHFFNENRIRQAASSLGAAQYCVNEAVEYAKHRKPFGKALATNQAIQFPLVDLQARCEMLRALIHKTAWLMDRDGAFSVSDKVSMCNYQANQLCCEAADTAMQVHGGIGYSRYKPFEHIYRHHRRYRITEGADEIQKRRVAGYLFGFMGQRKPKGVS